MSKTGRKFFLLQNILLILFTFINTRLDLNFYTKNKKNWVYWQLICQTTISVSFHRPSYSEQENTAHLPTSLNTYNVNLIINTRLSNGVVFHCVGCCAYMCSFYKASRIKHHWTWTCHCALKQKKQSSSLHYSCHTNNATNVLQSQ
jgi:hypothetical protein